MWRRKDKRWCDSILIDGRRRYFYGYSKEQVRKQIETARRTLPARGSVAELMRTWLNSVDVRANTLRSYESYARIHIVPAIGAMQLGKLGPEDVLRLMDSTAKEHAPRTVRYVRSVLKMALGMAVRWDLISRNVASMVRPPKKRRTQIHPFTPEEFARFVAAVRGHKHAALLLLAVTTGLRKGEILALKWQNVGTSEQVLTVCRTLQRIAGGRVEFEPKTESSTRTIKLSPSVAAALHEHRTGQLEDRLRAGAGWKDLGYVFTTSTGTPMDERNLTRFYERRLEAAKIIGHRRFHDLRHTAATLMLRAKVPVKQVAYVLGHSSVATTLDTYSHLLPDMLDEPAEAMEALLVETKKK